jgi:DNA-binding transcriptional ArsR family regulator
MQVELKLRALAEPRRLAIVTLIRNREMPVGAIARHVDVSRVAISQHLRVLSDVGLITHRQSGTKRFYRILPEGFMELQQFLAGFWQVHIDAIKAIAEAEQKQKRKRLSPSKQR